MKTTRRNFLKGLTATTALPLLPSMALAFSKPFLDLPKDGYLFLMPDKKGYWVPEINEVFASDALRKGNRPATQQTPLYMADAYFHCGSKTWKKFRHPEHKTTLLNKFVGYSAEEIQTKFLMPRKISHPYPMKWARTVSEFQFYSVSIVSNPVK